MPIYSIYLISDFNFHILNFKLVEGGSGPIGEIRFESWFSQASKCASLMPVLMSDGGGSGEAQVKS